MLSEHLGQVAREPMVLEPKILAIPDEPILEELDLGELDAEDEVEDR